MTFDDLKKELGALEGGEPDEEPQPARHKVVIVDDDVEVRRSLELFLRDHYLVVTAADAPSGIAAVDDDVSAVVLDVKMQGADGFWASEHIQKKYPYMPIIFYSAYQDARDPYEIINNYRPFSYITKGDSLDRLKAALDAATRLYDRMLENQRLVDRLSTTRNREKK